MYDIPLRMQQVIVEELAEGCARVLWNASRPCANAINAALLREGAVTALMHLCAHTNTDIVVRIRVDRCKIVFRAL
jgi:hypothetical protein